MATSSSIHKPGWRSRRRSRLSLVERAVPRLGRAPSSDDNATSSRAEEPRTPAKALSKTPRPSNPPYPAKTAPQDPEIPLEETPKALVDTETATSALLGDAESPYAPSPVADETKDAGGPTAETVAGAEPAAETLPVQSDDLPADVASASKNTTAAGGVLEHDESADTGQLIAPGTERASPTSKPARSSGVGFQAKDENRSSLERNEPLTPAPAILASTSPASDTTDSTTSREHDATLELDWDGLLENGYTDPRDRSRPLPSEMDRIIRTLIRQALSDQASWRDRVILVTSPNERVSKTSAAINFAFGLTTVGRHHAVLLDVDTTGAGAVDRLGGRGRIGVTDALADESIKASDLEIATDLDRLTLIASGANDEDPLDSLASRRMLEIMRYLTEDPDTILVIDTPPILKSQEAAVLSVIAGQVVLAVEAGRTTDDEIDHALQRIGDRHNVSLVLNANCGIVDRETQAAPNRRGPAVSNNHLPAARRRLPKTAAAATGAVMLGLCAWQMMEKLGGLDTVVPADRMDVAMATTAMPERWSPDPLSKAMPVDMATCSMDCR